MGNVKIAALSGGEISIEDSAIAQFRKGLRGELLQNGDPGYDEARSIWNAMIDRRPALIARCVNASDIIQAVHFARENGILLAVKGGGHNIAGNAVCERGLMVDLSPMKSVRVDPDKRMAHVEPGATLGDFDHACQGFGLATPVGINSTTGISGLTLGGGFGWLTRKHGYSIDNLVEADVITADGRFHRANDRENSDLFWAIRGGGGNFGVVSRFQFQLHPIGPNVLCGLIVFPLEDAVGALRKYREYSAQLGEDTNVWVVLRKAPPLPFLPEKVHGTEVIVFAVFHAGDAEQGQRALQPIRSFGKLAGEHVGVQPYTAWQSVFDPLLTPGARNYWKSHNFKNLGDEAIDVLVQYARTLPSSQCEIFIGLLGGAAERVDPQATAYCHRDARFVLNVHGRWDDAGSDQKCIGWAKEFFAASAPFATGGVYVNFLTQDETARIKDAYGPNFGRMTEIKRKYDPQNLFRLNQNVSPTQ